MHDLQLISQQIPISCSRLTRQDNNEILKELEKTIEQENYTDHLSTSSTAALVV